MLKIIESVLANHPIFGNSDYIHEQLRVCYKRRLKKISAHLPVAGQLLDALDRAHGHSQFHVIGDTVVRCAIQHALKQLETGTQYGLPLSQCEAVFRATIHHIEERKLGGPLQSGLKRVNHLGREPYHGWVWGEDHSDDIFGQSFRYLVRDNYGEALYTPNNDEMAALVEGANLLGDLLPLLSRSALSHARVIAVFPAVGSWRGKASSSQFRVGGTIFLSRELLQSPWEVAEHLFHESLHQKLYDFRHGHSLLESHYWRKDAPKVCSLWNAPDSRQSNYWDTHRAVAAFHVYVHLSLLSTLAEERASELEKVYGALCGLHGMIESPRALERAHYLGEQIKELCWQELGFAGKGLIDWLSSVLDVLDSTPPPHGSYIHLLLDLYDRDAQKVELILGKRDFATVSSALAEELTKLITDEVENTRRVLSIVNAEADLNRFDSVLSKYSGEELGTAFSQVRRLISKTLLELCPDGYRLKCYSLDSTNPEEIVKQMVQSSSQRLDAILAT